MLFISHDLGAVERMCGRVLLLGNEGQVVVDGPAGGHRHLPGHWLPPGPDPDWRGSRAHPVAGGERSCR